MSNAPCKIVKIPTNGDFVEIRKTLRKIRENKKLSQIKLGEITGYTGSAISNWEVGIRYPSVISLIDWANSLNYKLTITKIED